MLKLENTQQFLPSQLANHYTRVDYYLSLAFYMTVQFLQFSVQKCILVISRKTAWRL